MNQYTNSEMKPLENKFDKFGMHFELQARCGLNAWYKNTQAGKLYGWTIAKIKELPRSVFPNGAEYPPRECLPSMSDGGFKIWFYMPKSKDLAEEQYKKLLKKDK
jgi:hypothetical protein